jgi:hypothetical protein
MSTALILNWPVTAGSPRPITLLTAVSARFLYFFHYHVAPPVPEYVYFACALLPDTLPLPSPWEHVRKWGGAALMPPGLLRTSVLKLVLRSRAPQRPVDT